MEKEKGKERSEKGRGRKKARSGWEQWVIGAYRARAGRERSKSEAKRGNRPRGEAACNTSQGEVSGTKDKRLEISERWRREEGSRGDRRDRGEQKRRM